MKRKLQHGVAVLALTLAVLTGAQMTYASQDQTVPEDGSTTPVTETQTTETQTPEVYQVTVKFKANGGKGTMKSLVVQSGTQTKLPKNTFKNGKCRFVGWGTDSDGTVEYQNGADISDLATEENDGEQITLYAQWKLPAPKLKKAVSKTSSYVNVTFGKVSDASGYKIEYSTNKKFKKNVSTVTADKKDTSARLLEVIPNKTYYIRMQSFKRKGGVEKWNSDWSKTLSVKVKDGRTLMNTKASYGIEADVKLNGSGSGYHAKLVVGTPTSAVSFGMQYDVGAANPYGSRNMLLIENVASNAPGDQQYVRPGNIELQRGKFYHLMITVDKKGGGDVYLDGRNIGSFSQPNLTKGMIHLWIEASGRLNGDGVTAEFANVKCKSPYGVSVISNTADYKTWRHDKTNMGLTCKYDKKTNTVRMSGNIKNLSGDWDSAYNGVSYRLLEN